MSGNGGRWIIEARSTVKMELPFYLKFAAPSADNAPPQGKREAMFDGAIHSSETSGTRWFCAKIRNPKHEIRNNAPRVWDFGVCFGFRISGFEFCGKVASDVCRKGEVVPTLRLLSAAAGPGSHGGEVFSCAFTPDGKYVLSGGWDGHLRLWEASTGGHLTAVRASDKPVSACAVAPDNTRWLSGSLDGMLTFWDPMTQQCLSVFLAHTRPIAALVFDGDGQTLATASWDRTLALWRTNRERDGRQLTGHEDIVAGCRFTPDGKTLLSWSHDGSLIAFAME